MDGLDDAHATADGSGGGPGTGLGDGLPDRLATVLGGALGARVVGWWASSRYWASVIGGPGIVLLVFLAIAVWPDVLAPHDLQPCVLGDSLEGPSRAHLFGTDLYGCDYLTQLLFGARTSMVIGGAVIAGAMAIATVLGTIAAWAGGWVDQLISRVADVLFAIPIVFTALVIFGITEERTLLQVVVVLTLFAWPPMVRLVRGAVRERLHTEHVLAARALGARPRYVIRRHLVPFSLRPMIVFALPYAATVISLEAILSFLGVALQLPAVSWGLMLANLGSRLVSSRVAGAPHLVIPGIALSLLVWALVEVGARIRDARTVQPVR